MKIFTQSCLSLVLLAANIPLWAQVDATSQQQSTPPSQSGSQQVPGGVEDVTGGAATNSSSNSQPPMITPSPVGGGEGYALAYASETPRTNYLRGGLVFGVAYDDNAFSTGAKPVSDVSYSIAPNIALDQSRSRLHWTLSYSPGFTFYQRYSSYNQSSHNLGASLSYRLSPHVTFSAQEGFSKTSGSSNQFTPSEATGSSGAVQTPNETIIAPIADMISDTSSARLSYQFSQNGMVGVTGNFSQLHYPNHSQVPGLFDSNTSGGGAFYTHRLSGKHYIGATYQFQKYISRAPNMGDQATQTHSFVGFYTFYFKPTFSFSLFGGPQHSQTHGFGVLPLDMWSPSGGGSLSWQGQHTSISVNYSRRISDGGGLQGAVTSNSADTSLRRQLTRNLNATFGLSYATNKVLDALPASNTNGHSLSGSAALQRAFGEHFSMMLGYSRLHQTYNNIAAISNAPNRDRVSFSVSYQFQRPLGR
jgi:hypothetical protein